MLWSDTIPAQQSGIGTINIKGEVIHFVTSSGGGGVGDAGSIVDITHRNVNIANGNLIVQCDEVADEHTDYLYRGIASRSFKRSFALGEYMEVAGATLKDGLLTINVKRNLPDEAKPKVIKIK